MAIVAIDKLELGFGKMGGHCSGTRSKWQQVKPATGQLKMARSKTATHNLEPSQNGNNNN